MWPAITRAEVRRRFRLLRLSVELSQVDAAIEAQMSFYRYRLIENGYIVATEDEQTALARVFQTTVDELYRPSEKAIAS